MDLTTQYLGLTLKNPLVASPAPPNSRLDYLRKLEDNGIGAVVLPSLFEEQLIDNSNWMEEIAAQSEANSPEVSGNYLPTGALDGPYGVGPEEYLRLVEKASKSLDVPVIASLNGATPGGWTEHAALIEQAGADALELNIYYVPVDIHQSGAEIEQQYLDVLTSVREKVKIPVVVKMPPYFSSIGHMASRLVDRGANGLVIFNRYLQPDIDLARMHLSSELELSSPHEIHLSLLWIAALAQQLPCSLAGSTGVESVDEVVKYLLAGADVVMTTSALLRHGPEYIQTLLTELDEWCDRHGADTVDRVRGVMSRARLKSSMKGVYERANYVHLIKNFSSHMKY